MLVQALKDTSGKTGYVYCGKTLHLTLQQQVVYTTRRFICLYLGTLIRFSDVIQFNIIYNTAHLKSLSININGSSPELSHWDLPYPLA